MGGAALPAAIGLQVAGGLFGAKSAQQEGQAQEGYYRYLSGQATQEANLVQSAGDKQAHGIQGAAAAEYGRLKRDQAQTEGAQVAAEAANGTAGSVTAEDISRDTANKARLDEMAIRYNADTQADETLRQSRLTAYGLRSQAQGYNLAGDNAAAAGKRQAYSTLLGAATSIASTYASNWRPSTLPTKPGSASSYSGVVRGLSPFGAASGTDLQIARPY